MGGLYRFDRSIWIRFWGEMSIGITMFMIWPFLPIYLHNNLGASYTTAGLVLSLGPVTATAGSFLGGYLADKWGRRPVLLLSLIANALVLVGFALAHSILMFTVCIAFQGIFNAMYGPAANAMVADVTPPEFRQEAYGLFRIAMNVGSALGPLVGMVMFFLSPQIVFNTAAAVLLIFLVITYIWVPETVGPSQEVQASADEKAHFLKKMIAGSGYEFLFKDHLFLLFLVSGIFGSIAYSQSMITFPLYLDSAHHASNTVGWAEPVLGTTITAWLNEQLSSGAKLFALLLSMNSLIVVVFQLPITRWVARYPVGIVLSIGALLEAVGLLMLSGSLLLGWLVFSFTVFTIGEMLKAPTSTQLIADLSPEDMRGRYMGAASLQWVIGNGTAPVLGGFFLDHYSGSAVMLAAGAIGIISAWGFLWVSRLLMSKKVASV